MYLGTLNGHGIAEGSPPPPLHVIGDINPGLGCHLPTFTTHLVPELLPSGIKASRNRLCPLHLIGLSFSPMCYNFVIPRGAPGQW